jgi:nucleoside-triphosphatase THEP1
MAVQLSKNSPGALLASSIFPNNNKPKLQLVTGPRGSGKTLWCMDLVRRAHVRGLNLCGLISPAIFLNDKKIGIGLKDLKTGEQHRLAYRKGDENGDIQTQDWQMVAETMEWGNSVLEQIESCDLFVLDEIGPFELDHGIGLVAGLEIIDKAKDFPCVVVIRPSLIKKALARWHWAEVLDVSTEIAL